MISKQLVRTFALPIIKVLLATAAFTGVVLYLKGNIRTAAIAIQEQKRAIFVMERRNDTVTQIKENFQLIGNADETILASRPPIDDLGAFIQTLRTLASRHGFTQTLDILPPAPDTARVEYTIELTGNLEALPAYLEAFESLPYLTHIMSIDTKAAVGSRPAAILLRAAVFTAPPPDQSASEE